MAKRRPPRSEAIDASTTAPPKPRRSRGSNDQRGVDPGPRPEALNPADTIGSASTASEPSEEEIRRRAYQRYLERGGGHGMAFDDWLRRKEN